MKPFISEYQTPEEIALNKRFCEEFKDLDLDSGEYSTSDCEEMLANPVLARQAYEDAQERVYYLAMDLVLSDLLKDEKRRAEIVQDTFRSYMHVMIRYYNIGKEKTFG